MVDKNKSIKEQYAKYVCGIDVAQRLYACKFPQDTMFYWIANPIIDTLILCRGDMPYYGDLKHRFAAPTAMEIKEHFPLEVWVTAKTSSLHRMKGLFHFSQYGGRHIVSLMVTSQQTEQVYEFHREEDSNEANACGAMLSYIHENNMIA